MLRNILRRLDRYSSYKKDPEADDLTSEEFASIKWPKFKIVVATEEDAHEMRLAFRAMHECREFMGIMNDSIMVNTLAHQYDPECNNIEVDWVECHGGYTINGIPFDDVDELSCPSCGQLYGHHGTKVCTDTYECSACVNQTILQSMSQKEFFSDINKLPNPSEDLSTMMDAKEFIRKILNYEVD
jgi:hypothetical protein